MLSVGKKNYMLATGLALFVLSALLFISTVFSFSSPPASPFFALGSVLVSVYGLSSLAVPLFLVGAGILCFCEQWNFRRYFYIGCAPIPFFTLVAAEKLCSAVTANNANPLYFIVAIGLIIICALFILVEFLLIGILADRVEAMVIKQLEFKPKTQAKEKSPVSHTAGHESAAAAEPAAAAVKKEERGEILYADELLASGGYYVKNFFTSPQALPPPKLSVCNEAPTAFSGTQSVFAQPLSHTSDPDYEEEPLVTEILAAAASSADPAFLDTFLAEHGEIRITEEKEDDDTNETVSVEEEPRISEEPITIVLQVPELRVEEEPELTDTADEPELYNHHEARFLDDPFADDEAVQAPSIAEVQSEALYAQYPVYEKEDSSAEDHIIEETPAESVSTERLSGLNQSTSPSQSGMLSQSKRFSQSELLSQAQSLSRSPALALEEYRIPSQGLLTSYPGGEYWVIDEETERAARLLKETLSEFKIEAEVTGIRKGPVVTMFEILPAPGVKLSKIVALQDNIALRLAASSVRIVAPIPGKHAVGIEVPNRERSIVSFKELIETDSALFDKMAVPVVLGKDITGNAQIIDLAKTPHLLIAGATGAGKSVCVNSIILSILYKRSPADVKLMLIDPKIVELKLYNDIPHLLTPVITEPKRAFQSLQYCLCEMERRYALLDGLGVRDIVSYNRRIRERRIAAEKLAYIVVIIDEFADLMATTGKELESTVARLAAMSRAVGIHLVLATQRPSIDVITGLIKANIPSRIAFMVASKTDSRIIIDQVGAEKLLGRGDMLYTSASDPFPMRIQGTFVSDTEVENVVEYVKQFGEPEYIDDEIFVEDEDDDIDEPLFGDSDPLYDKALEIVIQSGKASASYIQRRLKIGYNRAARLVEEMEERGIVGPANGSKPREIIHMP